MGWLSFPKMCSTISNTLFHFHVAFNLLFAKAFNLNKSKISLFGGWVNGTMTVCLTTVFWQTKNCLKSILTICPSAAICTGTGIWCCNAVPWTTEKLKILSIDFLSDDKFRLINIESICVLFWKIGQNSL